MVERLFRQGVVLMSAVPGGSKSEGVHRHACMGSDVPDHRAHRGGLGIWWHCRLRGGDCEDYLLRRDRSVRHFGSGWTAARSIVDCALTESVWPSNAIRPASAPGELRFTR